MDRNAWMAVAFVCAASAGVAAQSGAGATSAMADKTITVTGCVQNISSSAPSGSTQKGFLLANATTASASTSSAAATPGSTPAPSPTQSGTAAGTPTGTSGSATASSPSMGTSYVLSGKDSELKDHVGHRVEVTGTVEAKTSTTSTSTSTPTSTETSSTSTMTTNPKLTVTSVKMIASDCSTK